MNEKEIIEIAVGRSDALNNYWNLFIAVSTGLIGIMASGKVDTNKKFKTIFSIAFIIFAASNIFGILELNGFRESILETLPNSTINRIKLIKFLGPETKIMYILTHGILDLSILSAIWFVKWPELKS